MRLAKALTPRGCPLPNWGLNIQKELLEEEEHARKIKAVVDSEVTKTKKFQTNELYSPKSFNNAKKRVLESNQSYELSLSPTTKKLCIKGAYILGSPTFTFSNAGVTPTWLPIELSFKYRHFIQICGIVQPIGKVGVTRLFHENKGFAHKYLQIKLSLYR